MDESVSAVVLLIGLAVGVDYSMFYLKREREERARGRGPDAALEAAEATSGRAVVISGATVIISMAGLFFTRDATFMSFAVAMMMVVAIAMVGSVTVLPALLSRLGDNVDRLAIPGLHRMTKPDGESRVWGAILDHVLRRPVISAVLAGGVLVALALPALEMKTTTPGPETYPKDLPVMQVYNRVQDSFPGSAISAIAVIKASNVRSPEVTAALRQVETRALASDVLNQPIETRINPEGTVAIVSIRVDGEGTDDRSVASLDFLRNEIMPVTLGAIDGAEAGVTGDTALSEDFNDQMKSSLPWVLAFVLGFAFILLLVSFARSSYRSRRSSSTCSPSPPRTARRSSSSSAGGERACSGSSSRAASSRSCRCPSS